jgi:ATP-dependent DNA helicase RecQ
MNTLEQARGMLKEHFGFSRFLPGQEEALNAILTGQDSLVVMPTGGGKSLCYQLPALVLEGMTLVVSPLIALMKDQVDGLTAKGISAAAIHSALGESELDDRIRGMTQGRYRLVYIAPERFRSEKFLRALAPLSIALFALDEAHCISQWGHDFRPDYLRMKAVLAELGEPPVVALTATATPPVRDDIIRQLGLGCGTRAAPQVFVSGFARHNLNLGVVQVGGRHDKLRLIHHAIERHKSGIVYCATRKNVERVTLELKEFGLRPLMYHGGMDDHARHRAQDAFMSADHPVVIATNAFGMGIDRPDMRFVLHHDLPGSLESYYQEAGRAGRDGEAAQCDLLFNYADVRTQEFFIDGANPSAEIVRGVYAAIAVTCAKGPAEVSPDAIAERLPEKTNDMAVSTAIMILERAGVISRTYQPDSRTALFNLADPPVSGRQLPIDFDALAKKRQRDELRLSRMIRYADARECRHRFILDYFGDTSPLSTCTACDHCRQSSRPAATKLPDAEETIILQKALSCVARMNGRYGRGRVTQVLMGSSAKEITAAGLDKLSTYGLLSEEGSDYIWSLLDALVNAGCLAVSGGEYPLLSLTPLGDDVMRLRRSLPLHMPRRRSRPAPGLRASRTNTGTTDEAPYDEAVFAALKQFRREKAAELGNVPAFVVFTDRTLRDLARTLPTDETSLRLVRGIGTDKAARFGAETLAVIQRTEKSA